MHVGCCHGSLIEGHTGSNLSKNSMASGKQINIKNGTQSTVTASQNVKGIPAASLKYVGSTEEAFYYYPKICARHRVPSVLLLFIIFSEATFFSKSKNFLNILFKILYYLINNMTHIL